MYVCVMRVCVLWICYVCLPSAVDGFEGSDELVGLGQQPSRASPGAGRGPPRGVGEGRGGEGRVKERGERGGGRG